MITEDFVKRHFKKRGYKVAKIWVTGRSYVGLILIDKKKFFFKFSRNTEVGKSVHNEIVWNEKINPLSLKNNWPIIAPKVYYSGRINGSYWCIRDYFKSENILSDPGRRWIVPNFVGKYLDKVIDFLLILSKVRIKLPSDKPNYSMYYFEKDSSKINNKIMKSARNFAGKTNYNCNNILKMIRNTRFDKLGLTHLDVKPWHLFKAGRKLALIDGEWASNKIVRYYDVASFYSRVFTILRRPDIADEFLKRYCNKLPEKEIKKFKLQFRALAGWIAIDELQDAIKRRELCRENYELVKKVEMDELFNF